MQIVFCARQKATNACHMGSEYIPREKKLPEAKVDREQEHSNKQYYHNSKRTIKEKKRKKRKIEQTSMQTNN